MAVVNYTTGPISSSSDIDQIRVEILNNSSRRRTARLRLYDLSFAPKRLLISQELKITSRSTATIDIPAEGLERWEVQISTSSTSVRPWIGGKSQGKNIPGTVVLNADLMRFG
ncbi:hypothetical protein [Thermosyntropha sp.]|uniref:hypothetical protein n=1 Tax=Thermosyntropha sp. TaxID=2740820 RepID=UPI0025D55889|nr:hypothetical protein [Thermosyntropha sp.]MBO8159164.1 hypothetical protein [Thermosyntropha sp.]